jgi:hypothetical protein
VEYTDIDTLSGRDPLKARPRYFFIAQFFTSKSALVRSAHLRLDNSRLGSAILSLRDFLKIFKTEKFKIPRERD